MAAGIHIRLLPSNELNVFSLVFLSPRLLEVAPSRGTTQGIQRLCGERAQTVVAGSMSLEVSRKAFMKVDLGAGRELSIDHWDDRARPGSLLVWAGPPVNLDDVHHHSLQIEYRMVVEASGRERVSVLLL